MRSFLDRLAWKFRNFMVGRYGNDDLNKFLLWTGILFWFLALFINLRILLYLYYFCIIWALYRTFSKKIYKRQKELWAYQKFIKKPKQFINVQKRKWHDRKTHKYFRCSCGAYLRVPKGKGKINITCNACGKVLIRKSWKGKMLCSETF